MGAAWGSAIGIFQGIDQQVGSIEANRIASKVAAEDAKANIEIARQAGADAIARGAQEAAKKRMEAAQVIGRQRVAFGASGVDGSVGTPVELAASTRMFSELDARTIENNAFREAMGFKATEDKINRQTKANKTMAELDKWKTLLPGGGPAVSILGGLGVTPWEQK